MPQGGFTPPEEVSSGAPARPSRVGTCDYIAGMTDIYAVERYSDAFIPKAWTVK